MKSCEAIIVLAAAAICIGGVRSSDKECTDWGLEGPYGNQWGCYNGKCYVYSYDVRPRPGCMLLRWHFWNLQRCVAFAAARHSQQCSRRLAVVGLGLTASLVACRSIASAKTTAPMAGAMLPMTTERGALF